MAVLDRTVIAGDGVRLAAGVTGDDAAPPFLLIPGLGATATVFDPIVPALARHYRTLLYDPRGVGGSEPGSAPLTMELMASDAVSVMQQLDAPRAHVLGASMGGTVAQYVAVLTPSHVERLVLAATSPGGQKAIPADPRATNALLGRGGRTPEEAYRIACTVLYSPRFQRAHPEFIDEQVRQRAARPVRPRVFAAQMAALAAVGAVTDRLREIRMPCLVAHGTADAVTPVENARLLASLIPGARTRWFDDCGHLFFHERPDESARVVHEFLRD
ncbi:MAG: alpha/beta fold hydrolase [Candidatus Dormibacteraeota bacterium]|nr:alpha/beta fold hydrolase [Candidatus Dormibacteraeota bacterium]MBV9525533.1 alpha/beta fold hydrolase [Candidatus Dormibacteraeota bacterium]